MIVVTGATGVLGRAIVKNLVRLVPASKIGASVRDPAKAADLKALGVRVRRGDFDSAESLQHAFEGASQILIVSSNARASGGDPLGQHRAAFETARAVGAQRIVYTSHMAASLTSKFPPARDHAASEAMLAESGMKWTALRHGFYASSAFMMLGDGLEKGLFEAPADGPVAWTAHADLALADAVILANGGFDGPTPALTGSEALDLDGMAAVATKVLGRPVTRAMLTDDDMTARLTARGMPLRAVDMVMGLYLASRDREFATVDPTLPRLIGRQPVTMRELIAERVSNAP